MRSGKEKVMTLLKIFISLFLLYNVFKGLNFSKAFNIISEIDIKFFLISFFFYFILNNFFYTLRLYHLLRNNSSSVSIKKLMKIHYISLLFQFSLPTSYGTDVIKAGYLFSHGEKIKTVNSLVFLRITGLITLCLFFIFSSHFAGKLETEKYITPLYLFLLTAAAAAILVMILIRKLPQEIKHRNKIITRGYELGLRTIDNMLFFIRRPAVLSISILLSILYNASQIFSIYFLYKAIGINIPLLSHFAYIPLVTILTALPISLNGIGVREKGMMFFFQNYLSTNSLLAFSVLNYLIGICMSITGMILFLTNKKKPQF